MPRLLLSNISRDCEEAELRHWVESHGFAVGLVRIVRDLVSGASPAFGYVHLQEEHQTRDAIRALHGQRLKDRAVQVCEDSRKSRRAGAA